jgi:hypothetical protein
MTQPICLSRGERKEHSSVSPSILHLSSLPQRGFGDLLDLDLTLLLPPPLVEEKEEGVVGR